MRVLVHVGLPKTGSSAIQEYLYAVRDALASLSIRYPDLGHASHWKLAAAIEEGQHEHKASKKRELKGFLARRAAREGTEGALDTVIDELKAAGPDDVVILSHEYFGGARGRVLRKFLTKVVPDAEVYAIGYVRHPVSFYPSGVQQALKGLGQPPSPSGFASTHPVRVAALRRVFENVTLRLYDRKLLSGGDVIEDFREQAGLILGRPLPAAPHTLSTNASMSGPACALLARHKRDFPGTSHGYAIFREAVARFGEQHGGAPLRIPEAWVQIIEQGHRDAWNGVVEGLDYPDEVKARATIQPSPADMQVISHAEVNAWLESFYDPEFSKALLSHLRSNRPAGRWGAVFRWLDAQHTAQPTGTAMQPS
ncbi:hypothetical protein [Sphingomonas sp.]|uniref:hypothetical protein n=1 Tax=Sphingomonas sp. TaxID=28214 RepID=UPI0035C7EAAB